MFASLRRFFHAEPVPPPAPRDGPAWDALRTVIDPELGIDLVSLGMIREVRLDGDHAVVRMTLSTPGCPVARQIVAEVRDAVSKLGLQTTVSLEFDPPWDPEDMTSDARRALKARG